MTPRPAAALASVPFGAVGLRYLVRSPIVVRGPTSGIEYRFSAAQPVQRVARSDCAHAAAHRPLQHGVMTLAEN